ncbi:DEAD/DEAH box helicase [Pedobacter sp. MC2016-15]|uniref:DEAD/DEAH box helicase n=1 Tax=Pedobacter sp. MC2016-15 TaxID=2994473 RepID=UPI002247ED6C|nr:DEAD/DEAH box helicase [Pedobacter sp. MC2016-15]MCX2481848.1 DEAD/DEAH box helicase [Pedobacter sp. MC2016-15]
MKDILEFVLHDDEIKSYVQDRKLAFLESELGYPMKEQNDELNKKVLKIEYLLLNKLLASRNEDIDGTLYDIAYSILKSYDIKTQYFDNLFGEFFGLTNIDNYSLYYFYLASLGLKADKTVQVRLDLKDYVTKDYSDLGNWQQIVSNKILEAFILLVRKDSGYSDIRKSLQLIADLKTSQKDLEEEYLKDVHNYSKEVETAEVLLGWYHLSKTITETADYLTEGYNYKGKLESEIRIHAEVAKKLFSNYPRLQSITNIIEFNLVLLQNNSIWYSTNAIQIKKLKEFCVAKSKSDKAIIDLLPSQREAINMSLLDLAASVTVVEMPTSAGKTLLAEFNIIVTKALNADSKIIYVVPTRALVNQVYYDLKSDFAGLDFSIEKTSGAIEVDPSEEALLKEKIDILVSTPEKLDLLIRRNHDSVNDVALFVIDEAHMIQNGSRGTRLELLLAILKRERPNSKFMFLSPFLKNSASTIADWMGGNKIKTPIRINWKPAEKLLIGIKQKRNFKEFSQTLLPSAYSLISGERELGDVVLDFVPTGKDKEKYIEFTAKRYGIANKSILYLCQGSGMVDNRAEYLYDRLPEIPVSETVELVRKFIIDEVGKETVLTKVLKKKIALHHAGLSDETKLLIEHLIREKEIEHIFATSTLAEGVNFPVSAVYFDSYRKGDTKLSSSDFWNIAGRAGRTLVDNYGKLIFPFDSARNTESAKALIRESSKGIASMLLELMINADNIIETLGMEESQIFKLAYRYSNSLEPLVQYLIHVLNQSGNESILEISDLFKDSLGYHQLENTDKQKFIEICKMIYLELQEKFNPGTLGFADKTGFSVPSVLEIMKEENRTNPAISSAKSWEVDNLFNFKTDYLKEKIKVIAKLKETGLGTDSHSNSFNEEAVAKVLISWVKGDQLFDVAAHHPTFANNADPSDRINSFVKYINNTRFKASWGLGALEGIVNSSNNQLKENSYIPSMVYYGVDTEGALLMRMAGVPRRLAKSISSIIPHDETLSLTQIRSKISNLSSSEWDLITPSHSTLTGSEWKKLSEILVK